MKKRKRDWAFFSYHILGLSIKRKRVLFLFKVNISYSIHWGFGTESEELIFNTRHGTKLGGKNCFASSLKNHEPPIRRETRLDPKPERCCLRSLVIEMVWVNTKLQGMFVSESNIGNGNDLARGRQPKRTIWLFGLCYWEVPDDNCSIPTTDNGLFDLQT